VQEVALVTLDLVEAALAKTYLNTNKENACTHL